MIARGWQRRPGDRIIRRRRLRAPRLRRVLGLPQLFSSAYATAGSSIYYALGLVALAALGATPVTLAIAGALFLVTSLSYAEGTAMYPEAGGSSSFARRGFNELVGFASGWALMLSYAVIIAMAALTIPPYLGYFFEALRVPPGEVSIAATATSMGVVLVLTLLNVVGIRESSLLRVGSILVEIAVQLSLVLTGLVLILGPSPSVLLRHMFDDGWPGTQNLILGVALATMAYIGAETVSQMAEETRQPQSRAPRALLLMSGVLLVVFGSVSVVALAAMTPEEMSTSFARAPILGIVSHLPWAALRTIYGPVIALVASAILLLAMNAGMLAASRLAYSQGVHSQMPPLLGRVHRRFGTPYVAIVLFCLVALLMLAPGYLAGDLFQHLGTIYVFGALLSFSFAHASIIALRIRKPDLPRPFKAPGALHVAGHEIPLIALVGLLATSGIWIVVITSQSYSRLVGFSWMFIGLLVYIVFRQRKGLPLT